MVLGLVVGRSELFLAAVPLVVALLSARQAGGGVGHRDNGDPVLDETGWKATASI